MLQPYLANLLNSLMLLAVAVVVLPAEWQTSTSLLACVPMGLLLLICTPYVRRGSKAIYWLVLVNTSLWLVMELLHLQAHSGLTGLHFGMALAATSSTALAFVSLLVGLPKLRRQQQPAHPHPKHVIAPPLPDRRTERMVAPPDRRTQPMNPDTNKQ